MKKMTLVFLVFFLSLAGLVSAQDRRGGGGGERGGGSFGASGYSGRSWGSGSSSFQSSGVRSVPRSFSSSRSLSVGRGRSLSLPSRGPGGQAFRASVVSSRSMNSALVRNNMAAVNNAGFRSRVLSLNAHENIVGHYYWHNYNGVNFCHYYDRWGCNWYGWYFGSAFYWSCWWGNYWWWYDPVYFRWCYWNNGWWWQNPDDPDEVDAYNNGEYVPSDSSQAQETQAPADTASQTQSFNSKDGTRTVKVAGNSKDAFLYDTTGTPAFQPKYLASGVTDVRFSNTDNGKPLQIMLVLTDGSFDLYDSDGNAVESN